MELIRTSLLTGCSTAIRLISAFAINKVVAVVAGPPGMALIGQVQNMAAIMQGVSSSLFGTAAVKYTAEWRDEPQRRRRFLSLAYTLAFWLTILTGAMTAGGSRWLAEHLLNDAGYWWVFVLLGVTLPLFSINSLVLSVINGLGDVRTLTVINIRQSVFGLVISVALPLVFGLPGALAATALAASLVFVLLLPELRRHEWLKVRAINRGDAEDMRRLRRFAIMALTSAVCAPLAQLFVREWLVEHCSVQEAGYWQGSARLSAAYLAFFTTTLSVYFLPKFSALAAHELKRELVRAYAVIVPVLVGLFTGIWFARDWLIKLLFSAEFGPLRDLLAYQLIADFLKILSWVLAFLLLARARTWATAINEIGFGALQVLLTINFVGTDGAGGARGALLANIAVYAAYLLLMLARLPSIFHISAAAESKTTSEA